MAMLSTPLTKTAIVPATDMQADKAFKLADELGLELTSINDTSHPLLLVVTGERLELRLASDKKMGPVFVDFFSGRADYRRKKGGGRKQTLVRAVGLKGQYKPTVFDGTAGLGRDAFVLACQGCRVIMCEQNQILAALLKNGLDRASHNPYVYEIIKKNMGFVAGNSLEIMRNINKEKKPDVVYLDPMFPHRSKSALVKKEMQVLQELIGADQNSDQLLEQALKTAAKRVVVKRPSSALSLTGPRADFIYKTKKNRFDVYLVP